MKASQPLRKARSKLSGNLVYKQDKVAARERKRNKVMGKEHKK